MQRQKDPSSDGTDDENDAETTAKGGEPEFELASGPPRVITVAGTIVPADVEKVGTMLAALNEASPEPIVVQFCSSGGHLQSGWALHDLFRTNAVPVITAGFGYVGSAATIAFEGGHLRFLSPNARLMIHLVGFSIEGEIRMDLRELRKEVDEMIGLQADIERMLARRTGQKVAKVRDWCAKETEFTAREALKHGFADRILRARRPFKAKGR